ncbi:hypothetical protein BGZ80_001721 [Entomortierella chlamydospora]|uniref:F-box domain-containing protein n=1 Tax=Entomortierella chlamydospora TaxID=101097 RepID=A0A9P6N752_9FUNG|nr:hypothetical protein BGZ79_004459 [Entomortierella chlamydospora]KAG0024529.1 hypothetical protein BGZ80_001721 [Entomortierella chlamydospora]
MELLPTELLLTIVDFIVFDQATLASCSRLNRRWYYLIRDLLYKKPKLIRQSAFGAFLRTVDTPEMSQYLQSIGDGSCKDIQNLFRSSSSLRPIISASSQAHIDILSAKKPTATRSIMNSPKLFPAAILTSTPPGALVETVDLSMLPHRWETVDFGSIQSLTQGCPYISVLDLRDCVILRDSAVQLIAEHLGPRQLRSLVLSGCSKITDLAVLSLCAHATGLENLELSGCDRISDISVLELGSITAQATPTALDTFSAISESKIYKEGLSDIELTKPFSSQSISKSIKSLDLSYCTRITDTGIKGLQMGATGLTSLNLEGCYGVLMGGDDLDMNGWEDLDEDDEGLVSDLDADY